MAIYIFGVFNNGYTQCPNDSTSNILRNLYSNSKTVTQIAIHRDGNLMYYCYIRKLGNGKYIGLCNVLTGVYLTKIDSLFSLFEKTIEIMANKGTIVHYAENGELTTSLNQLYKNSEDVALISSNLLSSFNALSKSPLPPIDFSVAEGSTVSFSVNDLNSEIVKASHTFSNTYIYKDKDYNTVQINSYKSVLSRINETNLSLRKENKELQDKNQEILRQKKQFRNVILLILVVIGCGIGIYFLYDNLNSTQGQLDEANNTIVEKNNVIDAKNIRISNLRSSIDSLQSAYNEEHNRKVSIEERLTQICSTNPFIVTSCSVGSEGFSFDYYADEEKEVTVTLKAINEKNSEIVSNSHSFTVYKGTGSIKLNFYYRLSNSDYYYVVLLYDGRIIAGKRW
jgi:hypothetical protein